MRLQGGFSSIYEGRVEIYSDGQWQSICDDGWDIEDADVVCRQLGYGYAESAPTSSFYGISLNTVWEASITCTGSESNLIDCSNTSVIFCANSDEAGVRCSNEGYYCMSHLVQKATLHLAISGNMSLC